MHDGRSRLHRFEKAFQVVYCCVYYCGVARAEAFRDRSKSLAIRVDNEKKRRHLIECNALEGVEDAATAVQVLRNGLCWALLRLIQLVDVDEEGLIALGFVFLEDTSPHAEAVAVVDAVVDEQREDGVWEDDRHKLKADLLALSFGARDG